MLLNLHSYLFIDHYNIEVSFFSWELGFFILQVKTLNPNSSRSYQLPALGSYEFFRLVLSCAPVPTEVVSHRSSIWSLELEMSFPAWIHLNSFFFSPGVLTAQQKSDTLSCTFLFCFDRFTALSVLYQSLPAMKKSVNMGFFL